MAKIRRWDFHKGIRLVGDLAQGETRLIADAYAVQGRLRPVAGLEHAEPATGRTYGQFARSLWRFRGRSWVAAVRRSYAVVQAQGADVVCWTEEGGYPKARCMGYDLPLGLPRPMSSVGDGGADGNLVSVSIQEVDPGTGGFKAAAEVWYRFMPITAAGEMVPTPSQKVVIGSQTANLLITVARIQSAYLITGCKVFRGESEGKERLIGEVGGAGTDATWDMVDSNKISNGFLASDYDIKIKRSSYLHTFAFSDGYRTFESAPGPVSKEIDLFKGNKLTFDLLNDGYWSQPGIQAVTVSAAKIQGPLTHTWDSSVCTLSPSSNLNFEGIVFNTSISIPFISGMGICIGTGSKTGLMGSMDIRVSRPRNLTGLPIQMDKEIVIPGVATPPFNENRYGWLATKGTIQSYGLTRRGSIKCFTSQHSIGTGQKIVVHGDPKTVVPAPDANSGKPTQYIDPAERATLIGYRSAATAGDFLLLGDKGWAWPATGQPGLNWFVEGLFVTCPFEAVPNIEDGTIVRFKLPGQAYDQQGVFRACHLGFHIETDTTGLEFLDLGATTLTLSYFPRNNGITGRNLYRVADTGEFLKVEHVDLNTPWIRDFISTQALGDALSSHRILNGAMVQDEPPPLNLREVTNHDGVLIGLSGNTVRWTRKGAPHSWPSVFSDGGVPDALVTTWSYKGAGVIFGENGIYRLDGNNPAAFQVNGTGAEDGCIAPGSVAESPHGLIFLGTRGITVFDGYRTRCLTAEKVRGYQFFPARQLGPEGRLEFGVTYDGTRKMDSAKGSGVPWAAVAETAMFQEVLASGRLYNQVTKEETILHRKAKAFYYRGKYFLYIPADEAMEGHGTWILDLETEALTWSGIQPLDVDVDGDQLFVLTRV